MNWRVLQEGVPHLHRQDKKKWSQAQHSPTNTLHSSSKTDTSHAPFCWILTLRLRRELNLSPFQSQRSPGLECQGL